MENIIKKYILFALLSISIVSCDKGFEELNINPNAATKSVPDFLFTRALISSTNFDYFALGGSMQHMANYNIGQAQGDKYIGNLGWQTNYFENFYVGEGIEIEEVIRAVKDDAELINKLSAARIWRAYVYHRNTDLYGSIPYTEAGKGASDKIYSPKYDQQSFIYSDILKELEEATNSFDATKPTFGNADLIYGGNVDKWKKLAYSLMLRLGMRLSKVDAEMSETWVKKAIAGGVIIDDGDLAKIDFIDGAQIINRNPLSQALMDYDYNTPQNPDNRLGGKLSKTLIDHLKTTGDPRLNALAVVWVDQSGTYVADTSTSIQEGMQNGVWDHAPPDFANYSEPNPRTILRYDAPMLMFTNCETNLLLAEAALRGWDNGSAENYYNAAIRAGMKQWSLYGEDGEISDSRVDAYLQQNPFNTAGTFDEKLNQISTQKWVALCFIDEYEVFANWRRTGYPALVPTNYPGNLTGGTIPRRMVIGPVEQNSNSTNFMDAMISQGGANYNILTNRVWWDVQ